MGEQDLIAALERRLRTASDRVLRSIGDDAAVVRPDGLAVTSVDTVVESVHFDLATHSHADVGHKALGAALSDLAAMGARPGEAYVALGLPRATPDAAALELIDGLDSLARRTGTTVAGGDVVAAPHLVVSITATGWARDADELVYRDGARPGHRVAVTGELGGSGAGLLLLEGQEAALAADDREALILRHRRPEPRLEAGRALAAAGVAAMIDVSDGVATDAGHIAARSGVELQIELAALPVAGGAAEVARAAGRDPLELAATGGDDYELLMTVPDERRDAVAEAAGAVGVPLTWIGAVADGRGLRLTDTDGNPVDLRGYQHR